MRSIIDNICYFFAAIWQTLHCGDEGHNAEYIYISSKTPLSDTILKCSCGKVFYDPASLNDGYVQEKERQKQRVREQFAKGELYVSDAYWEECDPEHKPNKRVD